MMHLQAGAWIHIYPPAMHTLKHTPICAQAASAVYRAWVSVKGSLPEGLMTPRKLNRSWWCDSAEEGEALGVVLRSPLPFFSFITLQNSLLICCSVWGVWIVPASITIITRTEGALSLGPSHWTAPQADHPLLPSHGMGFPLCASPLVVSQTRTYSCKLCDTAWTPPLAALDAASSW